MKTLSKKEALIATMLSAGRPLYGLELVAESDGALKRGTVYVTLGRMEEKGWLVAEVVDDPLVLFPEAELDDRFVELGGDSEAVLFDELAARQTGCRFVARHGPTDAGEVHWEVLEASGRHTFSNGHFHCFTAFTEFLLR